MERSTSWPQTTRAEEFRGSGDGLRGHGEGVKITVHIVLASLTSLTLLPLSGEAVLPPSTQSTNDLSSSPADDRSGARAECHHSSTDKGSIPPRPVALAKLPSHSEPQLLYL